VDLGRGRVGVDRLGAQAEAIDADTSPAEIHARLADTDGS